MRIQKINRNINQNCAFRGYTITLPGKVALEKVSNPDLKQEVIDCCKYFEGKKYAHVLICTDTSGDLDINLSIPDVEGWITSYHRPMTKPVYDSTGIYISAWTTKKGFGIPTNKTYHINLNGQPGDDENSWGNPHVGKMVQLSNQIKLPFNIREKIQAFKLLGGEVEKARIDIEKSQNLNSEIDDLYNNQPSP